MNSLIDAAQTLNANLEKSSFSPPVEWVYRPLEYAWAPHLMYLERFGVGPKRVLFLGMNPGPYGMAQTGVPFGEIAAVRDWMGIQAAVAKPKPEHPKRPVTGFACLRSEVSGRRLWGLFARKFPLADEFFAEHFVMNYCPLVWMSATGANLTPDKLPAEEMLPVEEACQRHLVEAMKVLQPQFLIGVGAYAMERLARAAKTTGSRALVGKILHPSPASPAANRGWDAAAAKQLVELGVWQSGPESHRSVEFSKNSRIDEVLP